MPLDELFVGGDVVSGFLDQDGDRGIGADVLEEGDGVVYIRAFHAPRGGTSRLAPPRMHLGSSNRVQWPQLFPCETSQTPVRGGIPVHPHNIWPTGHAKSRQVGTAV